MNLPAWTLAAVLVLIAFRRLGGLSLGIWQIVLGGALLVVLTGSVPWRTAWDAIDWEVIGPPLILSLARAHHLPLLELGATRAVIGQRGRLLSPPRSPIPYPAVRLEGSPPAGLWWCFLGNVEPRSYARSVRQPSRG
jgi:hypothetical protein